MNNGTPSARVARRLCGWLTIGSLVVVGACERKPLSFARRNLPGMSIELPSASGITSRGEQLDYRTGAVALGGDVDGPVVAIVQWTAGTKLSPDELRTVLKMLGHILGPGSPEHGVHDASGAVVDTLRLDGDGFTVLVSQVPCGGRNVLIASSAPHGPREVHQHVVASLTCTPDPIQEKALAITSIPLDLKLPGWSAQSRDDNQLQLTNGTSLLMLQPMPTTTAPELLKIVKPMIDQAFGGVLHATGGDGTKVSLAGKIEGQNVIGWGRMIVCPTAKILALELSPDQAQADAVDAAVQAARCLRPDEPAPTWPDAKAN